MPAVVERVSYGMRERSERKDGGRGMRQMTEWERRQRWIECSKWSSYLFLVPQHY